MAEATSFVALNRTLGALEACDGIVARVTASLADTVARDGRVSVSLLDRRQIDAFRYCTMLAELAAAKSIAKFAERATKDAALATGLAALFTAETVNALSAEVRSRPRAWGVDGALLTATVDSDAVRTFVEDALDASHIEALAAAVRERGHAGDYGLDQDRAMIMREFRRFAEQKVRPVAEHVHREDDLIPKDIIDGVAELGCFGLSIPEQYGGLQPDDAHDNLGMCLVTEALSWGSLGVAGSLITRPEILSKALLKGGTDAQKEKWLPQLATGETLCAVAVTEPDFGSNVAGMKVTATKVDGGWTLNGQKTWCTFGGFADVLMVLARTNPDPAARHKGLSILLAEKPRFEGHSFEHTQDGGGTMSGRAIDTLGYRGMHSFDVFFEDYFVPDANLVGGEAGLGKGFYYQMEGFAGGRLQTAARATGVMQAAFDAALAYAEERKVFDQPIADFQLTQYKLAKMAAIVQTARQFTYDTARLLDEPGQGQSEAAMCKLWTSRIAEWVSREAMQIHGGMGYAEEYAVSRYWVDSRVFSIFEGAEEVLALRVVARQVLQRWLDEGGQS